MSSVPVKKYVSLFQTSKSPFWQLEVRIPSENCMWSGPRQVRRSTGESDLQKAKNMVPDLLDQISAELEGWGIHSDFLFESEDEQFTPDLSDLPDHPFCDESNSVDLVHEFRVRAEESEVRVAALRSGLRSVILLLRANRIEEALEVAEDSDN